MDNLIVFTVVTLITIILAFIFSIDKLKGTFTCNKYILNTYLYIILTFLLLSLGIQLINKTKFMLTSPIFFGTFLLLLGLIFFMNSIKVNTPTNMVIKHLLWLLFISCFALQLSVIFKNPNNKEVITRAFLTTGLIVTILTVIAFIKPEWISFSWGKVLFFLLLSAIIMELLSLFFFKNYKQSTFRKIFTYFVIAIFVGFILYDTKMMQVRAKSCKVADYIKESLSLFLDILNLFLRILSLNRN